ncbi:hypothetical protein [Synechocystis sp. PCC 7509]|uniref:hypothetical protein n=1 Tax=Synechocystis sp. PCC 7509 TaxID=927677 RepID=UPI0002ACC8BC|nr:hypothetical protein [Synechocystis sp. PCC 7509]
MSSKISPNLAAHLQKLDTSEPLDVVLELTLPIQQIQEGQSRQQKITTLKEAFNENTAPIEQVIHQVGGTVIGRGWLNQTLRAYIPAYGLKQLSELDVVSALDIPKTIERD